MLVLQGAGGHDGPVSVNALTEAAALAASSCAPQDTKPFATQGLIIVATAALRLDCLPEGTRNSRNWKPKLQRNQSPQQEASTDATSRHTFTFAWKGGV